MFIKQLTAELSPMFSLFGNDFFAADKRTNCNFEFARTAEIFNTKLTKPDF